MSANLLDPRLHRRAGADYFDALKSDGLYQGSDLGLAPVLDGLSATHDMAFADVFAKAVPVSAGVLTAWIVCTPSSDGDYYFGFDFWDADGNYSHEASDGTYADRALSAGERVLLTTRLVAPGDGRVGLDFGGEVASAKVVHDVGITRGRVPVPRGRWPRRFRRS